MSAPLPFKIGYLVPQFPGQTHIFFWREIAALEAMGVDLELLSTTRPPPGLISHAWSEEAMGRTTYLGRLRPLDMVRTALSVPPSFWWADVKAEGSRLAKDIAVAATAARALNRYCRAQGIGHLHVHSCGRMALIAALARKMGGVPYSLTLHGPLADYGPGQRLKWRHASFVSIITKKLLAEAKEELAGDLPEQLPVQGMGVDTDRFKRDAPYEPAKDGEPLRLFSCARLNLVKGHQDLMEAVRLLLDRGRQVQLDIAGEDDDGGAGFRRVLEEKITELGLQSHVRLLGAIGAEEVRQRLVSAHVFALASFAEPLGVAYMEAMSCGAPTIGTAAGGVPELISHGVDGLLVPPQNPEALAEAIETVGADPALAQRISQAGRERIVTAFGSERGAQMILREVQRAHGLSG